MNRATDLCTCGKGRDDHGAYDVEQHTFFPHPQPITVEIKLDIERLTIEFLSRLGEVVQNSRFERGDQLVLTLPTGDVWTIGTPVWRHSKAPEAKDQQQVSAGV
jgi:hypothetical protein